MAMPMFFVQSISANTFSNTFRILIRTLFIQFSEIVRAVWRRGTYSGHRLRHRNKRSWVLISPGCKGFRGFYTYISIPFYVT
jgi:hypothetical protein